MTWDKDKNTAVDPLESNVYITGGMGEVMNINIKPIEKVAINLNPMYVKAYRDKDIEELEQNYKEAIEALYSFTLNNAKLLESINVTLMDDQIAEHIHRIEIIEKATGQSWEEITK